MSCHRCSTEMLDMCKKYDRDGNGTIEFEEFLAMSKVRDTAAATAAVDSAASAAADLLVVHTIHRSRCIWRHSTNSRRHSAAVWSVQAHVPVLRHAVHSVIITFPVKP